MILRYLYHRDLAQASYLVGCAATGEALIVDPNRDIDTYIDLAEREGLRITAVTETHIHADYVSGSRELAAKTSAKLYLSDAGPAEWKYAFAEEAGATLVNDGDWFMVGNIRIEIVHTPGHTPEHISFLVTDTAGADAPMGIFTGDFVFVGDVGRPDLLEKAAGVVGTMEAGGWQLFRSLQRFKQLPDFVQIWPGHGAGSACGKALGAVPQSTVGYERLFNWAFQIEDEDEFVQAVLSEQPEPPVYFAQMKRINKEGPALTTEIAAPQKQESQDLLAALDRGEPVVDTRGVEQFAEGHLPGTINIPLDNGFVTWAGWLLPYDRPFHLIVDDEQLEYAVQELRMIGLDNLAGYWPVSVIGQLEQDGIALEQVEQLTVKELTNLAEYEVVDVRGATEHAGGHIPGSRNIPVGYLAAQLDELPDDKPVVLSCQSGRRSSIASSVALAAGKKNVRNLQGGFIAWESARLPVERQRDTAAVASS